METPVLKPGGFWICPTCGQRNKAWAPCANCGTVLAGMALPEAGLADAAPPPVPARRSWLLYALVAAGLLSAVGIGVALSRLLGSAALIEVDQLPRKSPRAAATPVAPPPTPELVPTYVPRTPAPLPDVLPATSPAAVYTPSVPAQSPGYSIPAPRTLPERPRTIVTESRAGADLRARQQAVRTAQARFRRAEAELAAAEGGDPVRETAAMEQLEQAARHLREAEAALDRARRRAQQR